MRLVFSMCFAVLVAASISCGHANVRDLGLGKVVVYRNGVAYFERRVRTTGSEIKLTVPADKIDDFLKSLTVRDARTGASVPVTFPSRGRQGGSLVDLVVLLPAKAPSEVVLTYITESPAWKPSYRVVLDPGGQEAVDESKRMVTLEGWAIVDNTSGEAWEDVMVGVGSSSALSFRYDLWSIRDVHREKLAQDDRFAVAPPTGASPYREETAGAVITSLDDGTYNVPTTHPSNTLNQEYTRNIPVPGRTYESSVGTTTQENVYVVDGVNTSGISFGSSSGAPPRIDKAAEKRAREAAERAEKERSASRATWERNERNIAALAGRLKSSGVTVVIEGYASGREVNPDQAARDRANVVRNQLVDQGVAPAHLKVRVVGIKRGQAAGVRLVADDGFVKTAGAAPGSELEGEPVGESHFQSRTPISVKRGASVMVSILADQTPGRVVYLYDPESARGNARFAFKAVRLTNPTDNTLEAGPVTVYGKGRFVGEGLTDPIPPGSIALIPFALDRQIVVEKTSERADRIAGLIKLTRGVLTARVRRVRKTRFRITNRRAIPSIVFARTTVPEGWELLRAPEGTERLGAAHLVRVELEAGETRDINIDVATPIERSLDLRSDESLDMVAVFLESADDKILAGKLAPLMAMHRDMSNHASAINSLRDRLVEYRLRAGELHQQIVSLKLVKSGGPLLRHLKRTMRDISTRVQRATLEVVKHQEAIMMARIRFQDAIVELTLPDARAITLHEKNSE